MREDGVDQLFLGGLEIHRDHEALDQFGDFRPDQMRAEQLAGLLVEDDLDQTLILAERDRLAVADEREAPDADIDLLVLGGLFGEPDRRDLRDSNRCSPGISDLSIACGCSPLIASTQMTPSCSALCASIGGPATSPIA